MTSKIIDRVSALQERLKLLIRGYESESKDQLTPGARATYFELMSSLWDRIQKDYQDLLQKDSPEAQEYLKTDPFFKIQQMYIKAISEIRPELENQGGPPIQPSNHTSDIQLPKITIPKFDGSYKSWRSFHDLFKSIIDSDPRLSPVQKLHYLKTSVTGEAERLLLQFEITGDNYEKTWKFLEKRYHNTRVLVNTQLNLLFNQPARKSESAQAIKELLDQTEECLHELKCLDIPVDNWDPILIYFLTKKLPADSLEKWEEELKDNTTLPKYTTFTKFLEARFRTLEAIQNYPQPRKTLPPSKANNSSHMFFNETQVCPKCKSDHALYQCPDFTKLDPSQRFSFVVKSNLCKNCLSTRHSTHNCPSRTRCHKCRKQHHTLIHMFKLSQSGKTESQKTTRTNSETHRQNPTTSDATTSEPLHSLLSNRINSALLSTAMVTAISRTGKPVTLRALIDSGSQVSFITSAARNKLNLRGRHIKMEVTGLANAQTAHVQSQVDFKIQSTCTPYECNISALVVPTITDVIPPKRAEITNLDFLHSLKLADPNFTKPQPIDLLFGADIYADIIIDGIIKGGKGKPTAQNTLLGWIVLGKYEDTSQIPRVFTTKVSSDQSLDELLKQFWEQEEISQKITHPDDSKCEEMYESTHRRLPNGTYRVELPFKDNNGPLLGQSRHIAYKQFAQLEKKLMKNPELRIQYENCIQEYIDLNHLVHVPEEVLTRETQSDKITNYYLPHHAVIKESSSTTKLRVVFNASSKTSNGLSLNEQLLTGPTIQSTLWAILLRWRCFKLAFTADIEKMYRMIQMHPKHQPYQRILWRHAPSDTIMDYQLTTVTFGVASAPYLAIRTLQQLAKDEKENHPLAAHSILNDFYVDDVLTGAHEISTGLKLQEQLLSIMAKAGFNLRKWVANHPRLIDTIPEEHRETPKNGKVLHHESIKTLGIQWQPKTDNFHFTIHLPNVEQHYTKRLVLSETATLFDPLGWLAPSIITAKIFMQKLWLQGLDWDQPLADTMDLEWKQFRQNLSSINQISIPRWVKYSPTNEHHELHGFCDASQDAYAAVIYMRTIDKYGIGTSHILTSKTKVAPLKSLTLPKLELCGAHLLAKLMKQVKTDLDMADITTFAWTDSEITLAWIRGEPSRWKTFIANRVAEIQQSIPPRSWQHLASHDNPADCASRGILADKLANHKIWWHGPEWLQSGNWKPKSSNTYETTEEIRKTKAFIVHTDNTWFNNISSFPRLIRVMAYCHRFIARTQKKITSSPRFFSKHELDQAEITIVQMLQQSTFTSEYHSLTNNKPISRKSRLLSLHPFLDNNQLIRVGGRLENSALTYNQRHPIVIPNNHHVTKLIIDFIHKTTLHGGTQLVLNTLRNKYWLLNARNSIRYQLRQCITCFKDNLVPRDQLMGNLPAPRVNPSYTFEHTGIDYAGPIDIKTSKLRNAKMHKAYLSIFVCFSTKALHIEVVTDLTTQAFIAALKRFISRRGLCAHLYSDCGTNFVGADKELQKTFRKILESIQQDGVPEVPNFQWHFNPPAAPHFGGLWEANVKLVKTHLRKTLQSASLTFEELYTVTCQIEACINSRPLSALSNDPLDYNVLTPGHFLVGRNLLDLPDSQALPDEHHMRRWHYVQHLTHLFWKTWQKQYLQTLQQRTKWIVEQENIKEGDLVVILNNNTPKMTWPVGRIINIYPGTDNLVRVVQVKTPHKTYTRPITKISKLPIQS